MLGLGRQRGLSCKEGTLVTSIRPALAHLARMACCVHVPALTKRVQTPFPPPHSGLSLLFLLG